MAFIGGGDSVAVMNDEHAAYSGASATF